MSDILYPQSPESIPPTGSTEIMRRFGHSDGYPAKVVSEHFDNPIFIIAVFDFRRNQWTDTDGNPILMISWYHTKQTIEKEVSDVQ